MATQSAATSSGDINSSLLFNLKAVPLVCCSLGLTVLVSTCVQ